MRLNKTLRNKTSISAIYICVCVWTVCTHTEANTNDLLIQSNQWFQPYRIHRYCLQAAPIGLAMSLITGKYKMLSSRRRVHPFLSISYYQSSAYHTHKRPKERLTIYFRVGKLPHLLVSYYSSLIFVLPGISILIANPQEQSLVRLLT
jgi:hypothetical protein